MSISSPAADPELKLLLLDQEHDFDPGKRWLRAGAGSALAHLIIAPLLAWLIFAAPQPARRASAPILDFRRAVTLTAPVLPKPKVAVPTQTDSNRGKPAPEVNVESLRAHTAPKPFQPPSPARPSSPPPGPVAIPDPPKIEAPRVAQTAPALGTSPDVPPPPAAAPTNEKPKLAFETPGAQFGSRQATQQAKIQPPKTSVDDAVRSAVGPGGGGLIIGDLGNDPSNPFNPAAQRGTQSSLELLSDPQGIDFRPYLTQILATVRRNWLAVLPESARIEGRRGRVLIQFIVDRSGKVPKLVIASPSGADALDRAAVTGISASHPFPPLPAGFKGDQVRLQFAFSYNVK